MGHVRLTADRWCTLLVGGWRRFWSSLAPSERTWNHLKTIMTLTLKPRPDSGLDCLICAMFARQRMIDSGEVHKTRRCRGVTYPESYITMYTSIRRLMGFLPGRRLAKMLKKLDTFRANMEQLLNNHDSNLKAKAGLWP